MVKLSPVAAVEAVLVALKAVRSGDGSLQNLQSILKEMSDADMRVAADLARVKVSFLQTIKDLKGAI